MNEELNKVTICDDSIAEETHILLTDKQLDLLHWLGEQHFLSESITVFEGDIDWEEIPEGGFSD